MSPSPPPMKSLHSFATFVFVLGLLPALSRAQDTAPATLAEAPATPSITAEFKPLHARIMTKLKAGTRSAEDLAPELTDFNALLAKYHDQKTDDVAEVAFMHALLYAQVLKDEARARQLLTALKTDFPQSERAKAVDRVIESMDRQTKANTAQAALIGQPAPALTFTWASRADLKSLADVKGKVVVLDFWSTWCGPCISSFPQVAEMVSHYQGCDVEVIGVTSLQGRVMNLEAAPIDCTNDAAKEIGLMPAFIKKHNMTWTTAISAEEVFNPAYGVTSIPHMAIIAPDGTVRHTGLHPNMPHEEKTRLIDALLTEFKLKLPAKS